VKSVQRVKRGNAWERLLLLSQYWVQTFITWASVKKLNDGKGC